MVRVNTPVHLLLQEAHTTVLAAYTPPTCSKPIAPSTLLQVTCTPAPGAPLAVYGDNRISCTCTGATPVVFVITVLDRVDPVMADLSPISLQPTAFNTSTSPAVATGVVIYTLPTATDEFGATVACTPVSGSRVPAGTSTLSCTATDGHGRTTIKTAIITVASATAPVFTATQSVASGGTLSREAASATGTMIAFTPPTAKDEFNTALIVVCTAGSPANYFSTGFPYGITSAACTATDGGGQVQHESRCSYGSLCLLSVSLERLIVPYFSSGW